MLDRKFLEGIGQEIAAYDSLRRQTIGRSDTIRSSSKRAIFALHRDDFSEADRLLKEAEKEMATVLEGASVGNRSVEGEGSFRSALEEYAEARLYRAYLDGQPLGRISIPDSELPSDIYLGGLCDLVGELQRRQVRLATAGQLDEVRGIRDLAEEIIGILLEMDLTGYLRNKFDQAKNSFRRIEDILYEVSLRRS